MNGAPLVVLAEVKQTEFLSHTPKKCKESVFEPPILLQNQANPQILLHFKTKVTPSLQKSSARKLEHVTQEARAIMQDL